MVVTRPGERAWVGRNQVKYPFQAPHFPVTSGSLSPPILAFALISSQTPLSPSFTSSMLTHHGYYDVSKDNGTK